MSSLLSELGSVAEAMMGYVVDVVETVSTNPLLLLVSGIMIVGAAVGLFGRLLSRS